MNLDDPTPIRTVRLRIEGRVQGVGYRQWTQQTALRLGLNGWVRNRRDASVEAVLSGPSMRVAEMLERCRAGPRLASAVHVTILEEGGEASTDFEVRPTL